MEIITWTEDLRTGHTDIDQDHRGLFELLARLQHDGSTGLINQETQAIVDALREYTEAHFSREEVFMREIEYPGYPAHKAAHDRFVSDVCALQSRIARGAQTPQLDIHNLLCEWLRNHVLVMDKALAATLGATV
ncbi:bacteriohemerythrin [Uliginosibacterium sediminicola]|jgi:hemerythrin|uniref:Bacteriohemerythrin n=1 Tax=Uliginosibacterium sediminicola TaxID=2024550 RepID=A0ABU9Z125_9RHOO